MQSFDGSEVKSQMKSMKSMKSLDECEEMTSHEKGIKNIGLDKKGRDGGIKRDELVGMKNDGVWMK